MGIAAGFGAVIAMLTVAVVLFLVFRFIVLWYWRVNEALALLKSIDEKLGRMAGVSQEARLPGSRVEPRIS
jgi:hypothetical protein